MIRPALALLGLLAFPLWAAEATRVAAPQELVLVSEHPVEGIAGGNLSGLAWCGDELLTVSDREDDRVYRLDTREPVWRAEAEHFVLPPLPPSGLPWGMQVRTWAAGQVRGGELDFEGLGCDGRGNRYLVSEAAAAVLRIGPSGTAEWLRLPPALLSQARASGMLLGFNALFEGLAVDPEGARLWLAAERERRGLLVLHEQGGRWQCTGGCVLLAEGGLREPPAAATNEAPRPPDFSGLAFFADRLFTLERTQRLICRRDRTNGQQERCWSYAATALDAPRRYDLTYGVAEALWIDAEGAWVGVDNGSSVRRDGEARPVVWRFAAPAGGWGAR